MHRVLELTSYEGTSSLRVATRERPTLGSGDVLIRTLAAPVNPSDTMFIRGLYGVKKDLPAVPGFEGSGVVLDGRGLGRALVGRRVAFSVPTDGEGSWSELVRTKASMCFPLRSGISDEQGSMLIVNPLTAWAFLMKARGSIVHTASGSALGLWLIRLARERGVKVIHVVRSKADAIRALGEEHVFETSHPAFDSDLRKACRELKAKRALDAVAGETSMRVMQALPHGGTLCVYGALSESPNTFRPGDFMFEDKRVEGFWLPRFLSARNLPGMLWGAVAVQRHMAAGAVTAVRERVDLTELPAAIDRYVASMGEGKMLFMPLAVKGRLVAG